MWITVSNIICRRIRDKIRLFRRCGERRTVSILLRERNIISVIIILNCEDVSHWQIDKKSSYYAQKTCWERRRSLSLQLILWTISFVYCFRKYFHKYRQIVIEFCPLFNYLFLSTRNVQVHKTKKIDYMRKDLKQIEQYLKRENYFTFFHNFHNRKQLTLQ